MWRILLFIEFICEIDKLANTFLCVMYRGIFSNNLFTLKRTFYCLLSAATLDCLAYSQQEGNHFSLVEVNFVWKVMTVKFDLYSDLTSAQDFLHFIVDCPPSGVKFRSLQKNSEFSSRNDLWEENIRFPLTRSFDLLKKPCETIDDWRRLSSTGNVVAPKQTITMSGLYIM